MIKPTSWMIVFFPKHVWLIFSYRLLFQHIFGVQQQQPNKKRGEHHKTPTNHLNTPKKNWVELDFCQFLKFWDSSTQLNPPKIIFTRTIQVQPTLNHGELPAAKVRVGKEPDGKLPFSINHKMRGIFVELTGISRSIIICFSKTRDAEANSFRASEIRRWWFRNPGKITS